MIRLKKGLASHFWEELVRMLAALPKHTAL